MKTCDECTIKASSQLLLFNKQGEVLGEDEVSVYFCYAKSCVYIFYIFSPFLPFSRKTPNTSQGLEKSQPPQSTPCDEGSQVGIILSQSG